MSTAGRIDNWSAARRIENRSAARRIEKQLSRRQGARGGCSPACGTSRFFDTEVAKTDGAEFTRSS